MYSVGSAAVLVLIVVIVNMTSYSRHYVERLDDYERALYHLQQEVCLNDHIRAKLGETAGCRASEYTVKQSVRWLAIRDTALDAANWLGFSGERLTDTYMFKLYLMGGVVLFLGLWLGVFRIGANREIILSTMPLLPTTREYGGNRKKMA